MFVSRHIQFLINSLLIIGSSWFFVSGEAARKIKCKTCKEFVESFEKVNGYILASVNEFIYSYHVL